ncbi:MAG: DEAD/DEAH box helicase family protein, partial [Bacteriovoracia bacterium]
ANKRLEIIAIIPKGNSIGIAHQKFGIFKDKMDDRVAFTGSPNFTYNALFYNLETLSCYKSWTGEANETDRVSYYTTLFRKIWAGQHKSVKIIPIEKVKIAIREKFPANSTVDLIKEEQGLIDETIHSNELPTNLEEKLKKLKRKLSVNTAISKNTPKAPVGFEVRPYQEKAIENWIKNDYQGFFEMATGTGKTITGLLASLQLIKKLKKIFLLILVPTKDLASQWKEEVEKFSYSDVNFISSDAPNWAEVLQQSINSFKLGNISHSVFIATYQSFKKEKFQTFIPKLSAETMLIADEAHNMGSAEMLKKLPATIKYRLGLSATPHRHFDDLGTQRLLMFFNAGEQATFKFGMEEAIAKGFLCQYKLFPHFAELSQEEFEKYTELTKKIARRAHIKKNNIDDSDTYIEKLLRDRRNILNRASGKKDIIGRIIDNMKENGGVHHTLVYCPEGIDAEEDSRIIDEYGRYLGLEKQLRIAKFVGGTPIEERGKLLQQFDENTIQCLLAMKCLDEGVDVKQTQNAIFVSSTTNPRQYIQRRGRVLRTHQKKSFAYLHDLIAVPPETIEGDERTKEIEKIIFTQEFKRYKEFAEDAVNYVEAMEPIKPILNKYKIDL